jgi:hypothetical protein
VIVIAGFPSREIGYSYPMRTFASVSDGVSPNWAR